VTPLCEFRNVGFAYPAGARGRPPFEIRDLSFSLAPGEVLGLIGPNAAGRTAP
jgi:ABC-type multidrug transport system ATPase subunit